MDLDTHVTELAEQGYTILASVIAPKAADEIVGRIVALERRLGIVGDIAMTDANDYVLGTNTTRVRNILRHDDAFDALATNPQVLDVIGSLLGEGFLLQQSFSAAVGPQEHAQAIHVDDLFIPLPRPHVPLTCNTVWALSDFTAANGATRIVPGSHRWDRPFESTRDDLRAHGDNTSQFDAIVAAMAKGSVLVTNGSLYHGAGGNATADRRFALILNYCAGWVRQQDNMQLGIPLERLRAMDPVLQQLVGVRGTFHGAIGNIAGQPPEVVLFGG